MGRILAIDWGSRRIGLAVTDMLRLSINSLSTLENNKFENWFKNYLLNETIDEIVVGMPKRLNGDNTHATEGVEKFLIFIKELTEIPIFLIDERLTSKEAAYYIQNSGLGKQKRKSKELLDSVSAGLILQSHLDKL